MIFYCPDCKRRFDSAMRQNQHAKDKRHKKLPLPPNEQPEPSMAELFIEGQMNRCMGVKNKDWLEEMLP